MQCSPPRQLALASIAAVPPQLILLDIHVPDMGGFEVCRRLKAMENTWDIPIIFLTAGSDAEERAQGLRLGAVDFINKLFHPEEMLARVRSQLELGRLRANLVKQVAERTAQLETANERLGGNSRSADSSKTRCARAKSASAVWLTRRPSASG